MGGNMDAAKRMGFNLLKLHVFVYCYMGFLAGIAGLVQAQLVQTVAPDHVVLQLVNTDPLLERRVWVQAGAFGEHAFTTASVLDASGGTERSVPVNGKSVRICLGPAAHARLHLGMKRFVNTPSYRWPWDE